MGGGGLGGGGGGGDTPTSAVTAETVHLDPIYYGSGGVTVAMHSSTPKCNCACKEQVKVLTGGRSYVSYMYSDRPII